MQQPPPQDAEISTLKDMLRAAKQESASLAGKLETKEGELKWLQHKYYTTKALHVQELEVVAQRMLLLQVRMRVWRGVGGQGVRFRKVQ